MLENFSARYGYWHDRCFNQVKTVEAIIYEVKTSDACSVKNLFLKQDKRIASMGLRLSALGQDGNGTACRCFGEGVAALTGLHPHVAGTHTSMAADLRRHDFREMKPHNMQEWVKASSPAFFYGIVGQLLLRAYYLSVMGFS